MRARKSRELTRSLNWMTAVIGKSILFGMTGVKKDNEKLKVRKLKMKGGLAEQ